MFLPPLPLLFDLLLLLQLLRDARLPQRLSLAALVGLGVQRRLQRRVAAHADHHLLPQLGGRRHGEHVNAEPVTGQTDTCQNPNMRVEKDVVREKEAVRVGEEG